MTILMIILNHQRDEILDKITEDTVSSKIKNKYINIEKN